MRVLRCVALRVWVDARGGLRYVVFWVYVDVGGAEVREGTALIGSAGRDGLLVAAAEEGLVASGAAMGGALVAALGGFECAR